MRELIALLAWTSYTINELNVGLFRPVFYDISIHGEMGFTIFDEIPFQKLSTALVYCCLWAYFFIKFFIPNNHKKWHLVI